MGRPVNANAEQTRADLLAVAMMHFGRDGFRRATTRGIAKEVGVSFATLHHYFGKKEALYGECIQAAFKELLQVGVELATELATPPTATRIERAVRSAFRAMQANASRSRFLLRAFVFEDPELVSAHVPEHRNALLNGALSLLGAGADEGTAQARKVRLIGLGMLLTRFVSASHFERGVLGDEAFGDNGPIEDYLVEVATSSLGEDVGQLAALSSLLVPKNSSIREPSNEP